MSQWEAGAGFAPYPVPPPALRPVAPYLMANRIPELEPYVVGIHRGKVSAIWGSVVGCTVLMWIAVISYAAATSENLNTLPIMAVPALMSIGANCFIWYVALSGGPQLAANPAGMWIRARKWPVKALFLPWASIERIYVKRAGLGDRALCVQPRDPRVGSGLGAFANYDQAVQRMFSGAKLTASVRMADRPEPEILGAVAHFSAGRVRLG